MKTRILILALALLPSLAYAQGSLSLSLSQARQMALSCSEDMQSAENSVRKAELDERVARAEYMPSIDGSVMGLQTFPKLNMMGMDITMNGAYMAGISLSQPLYAGGRIAAGRKMSRVGSEVAEEQKRLTEMDVVVATDNAYYTLLSVGRKVRMMRSYASQMDALYDQVSATVKAGMATDNELLRIEAKRSEINYQLGKTVNGEELCRLSLCNQLGLDFDTQFNLLDSTFVVERPDGLSSDISLRPELRLLEDQVKVGEQQIKLSRGEMIPSIGLSVGYNYFGNIKISGAEIRDGIGMVMLGVKIPIFHGGKERAKLHQAKVSLQNYQLDLQKNSRLLSLEVRSAISNLRDGYALVGSAQMALDSAEENLRVMQSRYDASLSTLTDLLDAQSQWQQSSSNLIEAQTQYKIYETEYLRATGRLSSIETQDSIR